MNSSPLRSALSAHLGQVLTPEVAAAIEGQSAPANPASSFQELISFALKGDAEAIEFFFLVRNALHFWDDLADGDRQITPERVNSEMFRILVELPKSPFYRRHQEALSAVLVGAVANWQAANQFEASGDKRLLEVAFVIRSDYANLLIQAAYLVGGYDWMTKITPVIRAEWTSETFDAYRSNLQREGADRTGENARLVQAWYEEETAEYLKHGLTVFNAAMLADTEEGHAQALANMIGMQDGQTVIDMGCGVGGVSCLLKGLFPASTFYGVTNVKAQVDVMDLAGDVNPIFCDYHSVPLDGGIADVVMFNESIGYGRLPDLLRESARLLKPGGVIAIKDGVSKTGKTEWSEVWRWATFEQGLIDKVAAQQGLMVIKSEEHDYSLDRYFNFISKSDLMRSRYGTKGLCKGSKLGSWFWLLQKSGD